MLLEYVQGDRLFFLEPGAVEFMGIFIPQFPRGGYSKETYAPWVKLFYQSDRLEKANLNNGDAAKMGTEVFIKMPNIFKTEDDLKSLGKVDSIAALNNFFGNKDFLNLGASKLQERFNYYNDAVVGGLPISKMTSNAILDNSLPTTWYPGAPWEGAPTYNFPFKFDVGDKIDFSYLYSSFSSAAMPWSRAIMEYNRSFPDGVPDIIPAKLKASAVTITYLDAQPIYVQLGYQDMAYLHFKFDYDPVNLDDPGIQFLLTSQVNSLPSEWTQQGITAGINDDVFVLVDSKKYPNVKNIQTIKDFTDMFGVNSLLNFDMDL